MNTGFGYYALYDMMLFVFFVLVTILAELFFFAVTYNLLKEKPRYIFLVVIGSNFLTGLLGFAIAVLGGIA